MQRWGYANTIDGFFADAPEQIFGHITAQSMFADLVSQKTAWLTEIAALRAALPAWSGASGKIFFEYTIPRLGGRADVILLLGPVLFVIEFKAGADHFNRAAIDQVWDYALDLKNFHESSRHIAILPILVATEVQVTSTALVCQFSS